jgi:hypothetical protein
MHLGVSDPLIFRRQTSTGGWQRGSPHAPDGSFTAADGRADCDTGGTERRPLHGGEVIRLQRHRSIDLKSTTFTPPSVLTHSRAPRRGNIAPESVFAPVFRQSSPTVRNQGDGTGMRRPVGLGGYEGPCAPVRGSILTRVPPSSIDRSAPRSMSSRCASSALTTVPTASSESRS